MHGLDWYDYGARHYDPYLARWMCMDPLAEKYYDVSPYAYCGNNPVNAIDIHGDTITTIITNDDGITTKYYYGQDSSGAYGFINSEGNLYSGADAFVNSLTAALGNLRSGGSAGRDLVNNLMNSSSSVQIASYRGSNKSDINGTYILWNPNSTTGGINQKGNIDRPNFIGLGHEMAHIEDIWNGTFNNNKWLAQGGVTVLEADKYATHIENQIRAENNLPLRTHYLIDENNEAVESSRIIIGNSSLFYQQVITKGPMRIPFLSIPFIYK